MLGNSPQGLQVEIDGAEVFTRLLGRYNAYNLLATYGVARELGLDRQETLVALSDLSAPDGRMERVPDPTGHLTTVVDYAHTPDALDNVLRTLRSVLTPGASLFCVVGAGGDRDTTKRPEMARIATELADRVIFTSDNPRSEDPEAILNDMAAGLQNPASRARALRITDRASAIRAAVQMAKPKDVIIVAGKGHETYQEIKGVKHPFDDRTELTTALQLRSHVS